MLDINTYRQAIQSALPSKRVGLSVYVHIDASRNLHDILKGIIAWACEVARKSSFPFNVVKFGAKVPSLSLLNYPRFVEDAVPALTASAIVDLRTADLSIRQYLDVVTQPVLHRKELLIDASHPEYSKFVDFTALAEQEGLFCSGQSIGTQRNWEQVLKASGVTVRDHCLFKPDGKVVSLNPNALEVRRYRTALSRRRLSNPLQLAGKFGFLDGQHSVFDYGCGKGDDVLFLSQGGVIANGWDPHFCPTNEKAEADIVNLGYVLNVIEDPMERLRVLQEAFSFCRTLLIVSVLVGMPSYAEEARRHRDGYITRRETFQKYFSHGELPLLIEEALGVKGIPLQSGTMFVFRNEDAEQQFRARMASARPNAGVLNRLTYRSLTNDEQVVVQQFWSQCIELGRVPREAEVKEAGNVRTISLSPARSFQLLQKHEIFREFEAAADHRKDELLVQFALAEFDKRLHFKYLPESMQWDIKDHFGTYSGLRERAKTLLFTLSDTKQIESECKSAAMHGVGFILDNRALQCHRHLLPALSPLLQVYVGCALRLLGLRHYFDLVKIHVWSGKITFLTYDAFEEKPVPDLIERIKVRLWQSDIEYYDYVGEYEPQALVFKSLYLSEDDDLYADQERFDNQLMATGIFESLTPQISRSGFKAALQGHGYRISGYEIARTV